MTRHTVRWWARYTWGLQGGASVERELPDGVRASWSIGTSREADVRLHGAQQAFAVRLDWLGAWFVSAPGATRTGGAPLGPGSLMRHGDGLRLGALELHLVRRGDWDDARAFGALREALHIHDWAAAAELLYAWPRTAPNPNFERALAYTRDLAAGSSLTAGDAHVGEGARALWDELTR